MPLAKGFTTDDHHATIGDCLEPQDFTRTGHGHLTVSYQPIIDKDISSYYVNGLFIVRVWQGQR